MSSAPTPPIAPTPSTAPRPSTARGPAGLVLAPFRALRYRAPVPGGLAAATAPPYDVISSTQRARLAAASAINVVRLILPQPTAGETDRYRAAGETLAAWRREGVVAPDGEPSLYVYEQRESSGYTQRGLVGALALADPDAEIVLPHENTMAGPVDDRFALTVATEANLEPIFLLTDGGGAATALTADLPDRVPPLLTCTTDDGVTHSVWAERDPQALTAVAADLLPRSAVIADGHHRYQTYLRYQAARNPGGTAPGPWDYGLALLVDAGRYGPRVEPIHRVLPTLAWGDATRLAAAAATTVDLPPDPAGWLAMLERARATEAGPAFVLASGTNAVLLTPRDRDQVFADTARHAGDHAEAYLRLDVTAAHHWLIPQVLGVPEEETTVRYEHDLTAALALAAGAGGVALLMPATPAAAVAAVASAGERMPRKSTLFLPKPRSGLLMRALADQP